MSQLSRANDTPALAVRARFAAVLEQDEHDFPMADWAELLFVLSPEDYGEPPTAEGRRFTYPEVTADSRR